MLSRRDVVVLTLLFIASLPAVTVRLYSSDEVEYFSYLRSLWFDRDVSFENEYQYFYDHRIAQSADFHRTFLELETATGRRINYGTMGCAILWSPFYAVADVTTRVMRAAGRDIAADGYSRLYVSAVAYGSAFYGFAAIVLSIAAARYVVGQGALSSGLTVWLGTPLLFYMYIAPPFSHACSAFAVALFVTVWLRVREWPPMKGGPTVGPALTAGRWSLAGTAALGLAAALMAMVREQDVFFTFAPALDLALTLVKEPGGRRQETGDRRQETGSRRRIALAAVAGCAAFAIGYLPQLLAYKALNGKFSPSPLVARKMYWSAPHALQVLADPQHGFFFWTPLAILAVVGLMVLAGLKASATDVPSVLAGPKASATDLPSVLAGPKASATDLPSVLAGSKASVTDLPSVLAGPKASASDLPSVVPAFRPAGTRRIGACMLLMLALQVYISGAVESWTVAGAFGQRRFVAVTILLVIGLAALRAALQARPARMAMNLVIALCVWWNVALMAEFGTSMMDRQRLELRRNAYDAFVTLPRTAPELLYRYFAKRSSFYNPPSTPEPR